MELHKFSQCIFSEDIFKHTRAAKQQEALKTYFAQVHEADSNWFYWNINENSSMSSWLYQAIFNVLHHI